MKINRLETHDRLQHFINDQTNNIQKGIDDCLKKNPLSLDYQEHSPYVYIYGHSKTLGLDEKLKYLADGWNPKDIPEKKMFFQPVITKPKPTPNTFLCRALSKTDILEICWILPPKEFWEQYKKGNVIENSDIIAWSIHQYLHNFEELSKPDKDDLSDERCKMILLKIAQEMENRIRKNKVIKAAIFN